MSSAKGLMLEGTSCGVEMTVSRVRTAETPYRPLCRCQRIWQSDPVCHRCACPACAKARAEFLKSVAAGGLLGETRRAVAREKREAGKKKA